MRPLLLHQSAAQQSGIGRSLSLRGRRRHRGRGAWHPETLVAPTFAVVAIPVLGAVSAGEPSESDASLQLLAPTDIVSLPRDPAAFRVAGPVPEGVGPKSPKPPGTGAEPGNWIDEIQRRPFRPGGLRDTTRVPSISSTTTGGPLHSAGDAADARGLLKKTPAHRGQIRATPETGGARPAAGSGTRDGTSAPPGAGAPKLPPWVRGLGKTTWLGQIIIEAAGDWVGSDPMASLTPEQAAALVEPGVHRARFAGRLQHGLVSGGLGIVGPMDISLRFDALPELMHPDFRMPLNTADGRVRTGAATGRPVVAFRGGGTPGVPGDAWAVDHVDVRAAFPWLAPRSLPGSLAEGRALPPVLRLASGQWIVPPSARVESPTSHDVRPLRVPDTRFEVDSATGGLRMLAHVDGTWRSIGWFGGNVPSVRLLSLGKSLKDRHLRHGAAQDADGRWHRYSFWTPNGASPERLGRILNKAVEDGLSLIGQVTNTDRSPVRVASRGPAGTRCTQTAADQWVCGCFVAGTLVHTERGVQAIETLQVGDRVWARDERTGDFALQPLLRTFSLPPKATFAVTVETQHATQKIETTAEHPFWVAGEGWHSASALRAGDRLVTLRRGKDTPRAMPIVRDVVPTGRWAPVYNVEVQKTQSFFVGATPLWVHNQSELNPGRTPDLTDYEVPEELVRELSPAAVQVHTVGGRNIQYRRSRIRPGQVEASAAAFRALEDAGLAPRLHGVMADEEGGFVFVTNVAAGTDYDGLEAIEAIAAHPEARALLPALTSIREALDNEGQALADLELNIDWNPHPPKVVVTNPNQIWDADMLPDPNHRADELIRHIAADAIRARLTASGVDESVVSMFDHQPMERPSQRGRALLYPHLSAVEEVIDALEEIEEAPPEGLEDVAVKLLAGVHLQPGARFLTEASERTVRHYVRGDAGDRLRWEVTTNIHSEPLHQEQPKPRRVSQEDGSEAVEHRVATRFKKYSFFLPVGTSTDDPYLLRLTQAAQRGDDALIEAEMRLLDRLPVGDVSQLLQHVLRLPEVAEFRSDVLERGLATLEDPGRTWGFVRGADASDGAAIFHGTLPARDDAIAAVVVAPDGSLHRGSLPVAVDGVVRYERLTPLLRPGSERERVREAALILAGLQGSQAQRFRLETLWRQLRRKNGEPFNRNTVTMNGEGGTSLVGDGHGLVVGADGEVFFGRVGEGQAILRDTHNLVGGLRRDRLLRADSYRRVVTAQPVRDDRSKDPRRQIEGKFTWFLGDARGHIGTFIGHRKQEGRSVIISTSINVGQHFRDMGVSKILRDKAVADGLLEGVTGVRSILDDENRAAFREAFHAWEAESGVTLEEAFEAGIRSSRGSTNWERLGFFYAPVSAGAINTTAPVVNRQRLDLYEELALRWGVDEDVNTMFARLERLPGMNLTSLSRIRTVREDARVNAIGRWLIRQEAEGKDLVNAVDTLFALDPAVPGSGRGWRQIPLS